MDLSDEAAIQALTPRTQPYWQTLRFCQHLGLQKINPDQAYWVGRFRSKSGGYCRRRLGIAFYKGEDGLSYKQALELVNGWFLSPVNAAKTSDSYPIGATQSLSFSPIGGAYSVGHALHDYVAWKRIAAAKTTFEANLSLINHHMVNRIIHIPLEDFNGHNMRNFATAVLETPPKRGNKKTGKPIALADLSQDDLRKRKKTLNNLLTILRLAFQLAWENGEIESDRAWRCLRRVPVLDRPRILFLDRNECRQLLEVCRPDLRNLVLGALYTGCRVSELANLKVADVAKEGFGIYVHPMKNYKPRFVFLPDEGMAFFLALADDRPGNQYVFVTRKGTNWSGRYKHLFRAAVLESGLPKEFVFHGLRHTYATQLVQVGTPLIVVAQQLGHSNTDTVSRTYGHLAPQIREAEIKHRFEPLDQIQIAAKNRMIRKLDKFQASFRGDNWRDYASINDTSSWPRSNFSKSYGPLLQAIKNAS